MTIDCHRLLWTRIDLYRLISITIYSDGVSVENRANTKAASHMRDEKLVLNLKILPVTQTIGIVSDERTISKQLIRKKKCKEVVVV